jgi:hypothetical protein
MARWLVAIICVVCGVSCSPVSEGQMRAQAAHDFECPSSMITVEHVSPTTIEVRGCGKSALYVCDEGNARAAANGNTALVTEDEARYQQAGSGCHRVKR